MYRKYYIITLLVIGFSLVSVSAFGQFKKKLVGLVVDKATAIRIGDVDVSNKRTKIHVISNFQGTFAIEAQAGDTILVTKDSYSPRTLVVKDINEEVMISLSQGIELDEVVIKQKTKEAEMRETLEEYNTNGVFNNGHTKPLQYFFNPVSALYNTFSRSAKNARSFNRYMQTELKETEVDKKFNKYKITEITGLTGKDLESFMTFYRPSHQQSQYWNEYDTRSYIERSFVEYKKNGSPKYDPLPKLTPNIEEEPERKSIKE